MFDFLMIPVFLISFTVPVDFTKPSWIASVVAMLAAANTAPVLAFIRTTSPAASDVPAALNLEPTNTVFGFFYIIIFSLSLNLFLIKLSLTKLFSRSTFSKDFHVRLN